MLLRQPLALATVIIASLLAGCLAVSVVLAPKPVTLATGTPGGIYLPVGNAICRMFNLPEEPQPSPCVAVASDGSVANIRRVERGESTFGLSQTDIVYAAFHGEGPFAAAGREPEVAPVDRALPGSIYCRCARRCRHPRFPGFARQARRHRQERRRIHLHPRCRPCFYGWAIPDPDACWSSSPADQNQALCDNKVDAIIFEAGHPNGLPRRRRQAAGRGSCASPVPDRPTACDASLLRRLGHSRRHVRRQPR